tara:strand:- start:269 stop:631 length:363 start_codon:yes stop_codon:yes gene_type:complete
MKTRSKYFLGILIAIPTIFYLPGKADQYFRAVVHETIENQIDSRKEEIDQQMRANIEYALHDQDTQKEIKIILQQAVAQELEENGESHLRRIIEQRAPHAVPLLFPDQTTRNTSNVTRDG